MKYSIRLVTIFLLLHGHLFSQSSEYIGLVVIEPCSFRVIPPKDTLPADKFITIQTFKDLDITTCSSDTNKFIFYENPDLSAPFKSLSFYTQWDSLGGVKLVEIDSSSWLAPLYSEIGEKNFCNLIFICKKKTGKWLEVVTNDSTKKTMWIKDAKFIRFIAWNRVSNKITAGNTCIKLTSEKAIRNRPSDKSKVIENPKNHQSFEIIKAKNDWIKISNDNGEYFNVEYNEVPITGWIKYKDTERLLIDFEIK